MKDIDEVDMNSTTLFEHGTTWVRADFHLHTRADKEFKHDAEDKNFVALYVDALKSAGISLGVISNHNKFQIDEFKAIRKRAAKENIGILPGVELSVNDGSNGIHTLVVFSDEWIENGNDFISQFLGNAFAGKVPSQYENENGRTNSSLTETLKQLEQFEKDFFVVFAHVENDSGLWKELDGGRIEELAKNALVQRYCLGFQKVRTHDKPGAKCRVQLKQWWKNYPAELEGSDPKQISEIGKGQKCFIKIGALSFEAVQFALRDFTFRVAPEAPKPSHSYISAVRFEGGMLDGVRIPLSPHMNCLIGIQGSGKSSILESIRYALDISFGELAQDKNYKADLLPYALGSGGKVILEAKDKLGTNYEVHRILNHAPDVYVEGQQRQGVSVRETVVFKPLYFGQKDLSAAGKGFGTDLVEKLIGDSLKLVRQKIADKQPTLKTAAKNLIDLRTDSETLDHWEKEFKDVEFRLEQMEKHNISATLSEQVSFQEDVEFCKGVKVLTSDWINGLAAAANRAETSFKEIQIPKSEKNKAFFHRYETQLVQLKKTVSDAKVLLSAVAKESAKLDVLNQEIEDSFKSLKENFASVQRTLSAELAAKGLKSIKPEDYVELNSKKSELARKIGEIKDKISKESSQRENVLTLSTELNDLWLDEFREVEKALSRINGSQSSLVVSSKFKGDKEGFRDRLEQLCRGSGIRKDQCAAIVEKYPDFASLYKDLEEGAKLVKAKAEEFKNLVLNNLPNLLVFQVRNSFDITYHGKPLKSHSLGQRASAMMLFLLSQDDSDLLLVDQPEDDLDSQTIYEEVVKLVRNLKPKRQFIFVTHNPNFPVLGDTEVVAACNSVEEGVSVTSGSIDTKESQSRIVKIMEGGSEAFSRRKLIYEAWHTS